MQKYNVVLNLSAGLVLLAVLAGGCQQVEQATTDEQAEHLAAARVELQNERAQRELEIKSIERQYNDILQQREAELATLREEVEALKARNEDLRDTIRMIRRDLARLQEVAGTQGESSDNQR